MDREDIIKLAREAGFTEGDISLFPDLIAHFAALVADAEREKLAAWMMRQGYATGHGDTVEDLLKELEWQIAEREREACAKICEEVESRAEELWDKFAYPEDQGMASGARQCAAAIRARGNI